jgi:hypothetical protein
MAKLAQLPCPVVAGTASFHSDQAGWKLLKECEQLRSSQSLVENNIAILADAVDLKDVFGQIEADCCNLHWVAPLISSL